MRYRNAGQLGGKKARLTIAVIVAIFSFLAYWLNTSKNPITGESQRIAGITVQNEIELGLQARDQVAAQFGGFEPDPGANALVDKIGTELVASLKADSIPWKFEFHVLDDPKTINAFALPGGQIFITEGLMRQLDTEGQLAGVLGHEIGHVIERHGAQQMAKAKLSQGMTAAAVVASGDYRSGQLAQVVAGLINMKYGRADELESDRWGIRLMGGSGYDPRAIIGVMEVLKKAGGGKSQPEFFSTHPNPENRIRRIKDEIEKTFPGGVPSGLKG